MTRSLRGLLRKVVKPESLYPVYFRARNALGRGETRFEIGIVTYVARYEAYFKPLVANLKRQFPDVMIRVAVNGYHDQVRQLEFLAHVERDFGVDPGVELQTWTEPQSLSLLWNRLIRSVSADYALILNDDLTPAPGFRRELEINWRPDSETVCLINRSWSSFFIPTNLVNAIGWFDERFPGVGNEDQDYEARMALDGRVPQNMRIWTLDNLIVKTTDFSYGPEMKVANLKYSGPNLEFFNSKWEVRNFPAEGYIWVEILKAYVRIRPGMATPNFYGGSPDV